MNISAYQSLSLVAKTAAFGVLDYSDRLNSLTSRITGGRVNRNTLAESILHNATELAMDIASKSESVQSLSLTHFGIAGSELISHANGILLQSDDAVFSNSLDELLKKTIEHQIKQGNITSDDAEPARKLIQSLINDHLGKQVAHQFLGLYAAGDKWNTLTDTIQKAMVPDESSGLTGLLTMAGVRMASGLAHSVINRGIVESASFKTTDIKPEVQLAANCLNAYLTNEFNCVEALANYQPSKGLIDDQLIKNVAELAPTLANHMVKRAANAVTTAQTQLDAKKAEHEVAKYAARKMADELAISPNIGNDAADFDDTAAPREDREIDDGAWTSTDPDAQNENTAMANNAAPKASSIDDSIGEFEVLENDGLGAARKFLAEAEQSLESAQQLQEMSGALKDLLVFDPTKQNNERITNALSVVLKSLLGEGRGVTTYVAGEMLKGGQGLPVQNILGTYIAKYGWNNLELMLDKAVENHLANLQALYAEQAAKAQQNGRPDYEEHSPSWTERAIPKLAAKLAVPHLKLYFGDKPENMKFDQQGDDHYEMLADVLKANQENIVNGDISSMTLIENSAGILAAYMARQVTTAAQHTGALMADTTRQFANTTAAYAASAAQGVTAARDAILQIGQDVSEQGITAYLRDATISAGTATLGLASAGITSAFSGLGNMLSIGTVPQLLSSPAVRV